MKLLVVISDRKLTKKILKILNEEHLNYHISFYGEGTADSSILFYFGLEKSEKEVIFSVVDQQDVNSLFNRLSAQDFIKNHGAVAFTIPIDGISKNTLEYIQRMEK